MENFSKISHLTPMRGTVDMFNLIEVQQLFKSRFSICMEDSRHFLQLPQNARAKIRTLIMTSAKKLIMFQNMIPITTIYFQGGDSLVEAQGFNSFHPSIAR
jgi:hypothetical protein